ncbi:radical SAM/SPASM domain-containing protein [Paenibacillus amylolyticus]|uniref:Radical SAM domain protein n=1 Tax=Paenibacillus amylolyticus TaxID=1451 RepID=A0A117I395_PAEAM|nr:radical SAM protein [Paenibacillus amylolyticus]GAS84945.1 radical SAM domain protein [Paenibacillus amylolyticus]
MSSVLDDGYRLHKDIRQFEIDGIRMIGNIDNGSIIGLDAKGVHLIEQINSGVELVQLDKEEQQLLECMIENQFFVEEKKGLKAAYVHLTDRCNLHCVGCYSFVEERNLKDALPFEKICHVLSELKANGAEQIVFSGGEPFIRKDIVEICKFAKETLGIMNLHVISNGTMNYRRYEEAFQYIDALSISIDGYNEETRFIRDQGIMPKIISNVAYLREKAPVTLIATIHAQNINHIDEYLNFAKQLDVKLSFSIFTVNPEDEYFRPYIFDHHSLVQFSKKISNLDQSVPIYDMPAGEIELTCRGNCEVGKEMVSIGADGTIYPCHMLHDSSLSLGNILEQELDEVLEHPDNPFLKLNVDNIEECKHCKYRYLCGGGCRGRSWLYNNTLNNRDAFCPFIKNFYRDSIQRLKESIGYIESSV